MDNNNEKTNYGEMQFINRYLKTLQSEVQELCSLPNSVLNKSTWIRCQIRFHVYELDIVTNVRKIYVTLMWILETKKNYNMAAERSNLFDGDNFSHYSSIRVSCIKINN
jgi:hypothetical protein